MQKYGVDTNVLIRFIVQDNSAQSRKATRFLEKNCTVDRPGHISLVVLCEIVWVLARAYRYPKDDIVKVLQTILTTAEFTIESPTVAWEAFRLYQNGRADFSDYIICQVNKSAGCVKTVTFDREAAKSENFQLL